MAKEQQIYIEGVPWTVRYTARRPRLNGEDCDGTMSPRERVIRIYKGGSEDTRLRTVLHEWTHVRFPDYDEDAVLGIEEDLFGVFSAFQELEGH